MYTEPSSHNAVKHDLVSRYNTLLPYYTQWYENFKTQFYEMLRLLLQLRTCFRKLAL